MSAATLDVDDWDDPTDRFAELLDVIDDQLEILSEALKEMAFERRYPAPRLPRGRPLSPSREQLARETALDDIEQSTEPAVVRARMWRACAQRAKDERQYQWAGFWRRIAEIQEDWRSQPRPHA